MKNNQFCYYRGCFELQTYCVLYNQFCKVGHAVLTLHHVALNTFKGVSAYCVTFPIYTTSKISYKLLSMAQFVPFKKSAYKYLLNSTISTSKITLKPNSQYIFFQVQYHRFLFLFFFPQLILIKQSHVIAAGELK